MKEACVPNMLRGRERRVGEIRVCKMKVVETELITLMLCTLYIGNGNL